MQAIINAAPSNYPSELLSRIAPVAHVHINMRDVLTLALDRHSASLLVMSPRTRIQPGKD
jgi:hypothetical protein